jgi:hypothetical protein
MLCNSGQCGALYDIVSRMTRTIEQISWALPDRMVHDDYLKPEFWLSGRYGSFSTETVRFIPIGEHATRWMHELSDRNPIEFAAFMADTTAIGREGGYDSIDLNHVVNGGPSNIFFLKGTTRWAIDLPQGNLKHLSPEVRIEMTSFACTYPYVLDTLRYLSRTDFSHASTDRLLTPAELVQFRKMPGDKLRYWHHCFPDLVPYIYDSITRNRKNDVISYAIQPISHEVADLLGVSPDPFGEMDE